MSCLCTFNISCAVHEVDNEGKSSLSSFLVKSLLLLFLPLSTNSFKTTSYLVTTITLVFRFKTTSCLIITLHNISNTRRFHANTFHTLYLTSIFRMIHIHAFKTLSPLLSFFYMQLFFHLQFPIHLHSSHISPKHEIDSQNLLITFFLRTSFTNYILPIFLKHKFRIFFTLFLLPFSSLFFIVYLCTFPTYTLIYLIFFNHFSCTIFLCF